MKLNPFKILKINNKSQLKRAYLELIRENPPEKNPENFKKIRKAYEMIKNANTPYETLLLSPINPISEEIKKDQLIKYFENNLSLRKDKIKLKKKLLLEELNDIRN